MKLAIIVAMTPQGLIGRSGALPWHDPADLSHFKRTTTGHAVIMGRKTFESIGKPLPNRRNLVLTRDAAWATRIRQQFHAPSSLPHDTERAGVVNATLETADSLDAAVVMCRRRGEKTAFVIGGAQTYAAALPHADELIVTWMHRPDAVGDTFFPKWNPADWIATPVANDAGLDLVRYARRGG